MRAKIQLFRDIVAESLRFYTKPDAETWGYLG